MSPDATKKQPTTATVTSDPRKLELEHQIRLRAYELYEARGRKGGHDLEDWLCAKEEITSEEIRIAA